MGGCDNADPAPTVSAARLRLNARRHRPRYAAGDIARMVEQARLLRLEGLPHALVALRLGVPRSTLYRWQGQAEGFRMPSFTEVLAENAELRRRLKQLDR